MQRLRSDVEGVVACSNELRVLAGTSSKAVECLEATAAVAANKLQAMQSQLQEALDRLGRLEGEKRELAAKLEVSSQRVWDEMRHLDKQLAQGAERSKGDLADAQARLGGVERRTDELQARGEVMRRHMIALEHKLESFDGQVLARLAPLHTR